MTLLKSIGLTAALSVSLTLPVLADNNGYYGGGSSAIIYSNPDFSGQSLRVTGAIPRLSDYRFNDKASSIRIMGGTWEVCVDANYRGRCEVIQYRADRLNELRLNDKITSIRPVAYGYGGQPGRDYDRDRSYGGRYGSTGYAPVVLFQHPDFRGDALPLTGAVTHLNQLGFNDKTSSIVVKSGAWEVCTDPDFRGRCGIVDASTSELGYYRLNDNITSIRPAGRGYGYDRNYNNGYHH